MYILWIPFFLHHLPCHSTTCSMDDVIERYRSEVIIDGVKLGAPIPHVRLDMCTFDYICCVVLL